MTDPMWGFHFNVDGEPFKNDMPMDTRHLMHNACLIMVMTHNTFKLNSTLNIEAKNRFEGPAPRRCSQLSNGLKLNKERNGCVTRSLSASTTGLTHFARS